MAVPSYGSDLVPFLESQGLETVRRLRKIENHFHSLDQAGVDKWISVKESELRDEGVSIARKALSNSTWAKWIAITALIVSTIAMILGNSEKVSQFILWISK